MKVKYKKQEMVEKIISLAQLPTGRKTVGVFTKSQIIALYLYIMKAREEFSRLKERVTGCQD